MERLRTDNLASWYRKKNRKPLVIRGARQVGKSTLVRNFAQFEQLVLVEINLEKRIEWNDLFKKNNPKKVLESIEDLYQKKFEFNSDQKILLFFDEIQATPAAISCLRYFYEEFPQLAVICAGSLLEFVLNDHEYSMPVGRIEFLHLGPMTFFEFLKAKGEEYILEKLKVCSDSTELSDNLHEKSIEFLKEYFYVGGMPEAVKSFVESGFDSIAQIHSQILETYQSDFIKYSKKNHLMKIQKVFRHIYLNPCEKVKYSAISKEETSRDLKLNLELLFMSKVATPVFHTNCSGIPLEISKSDSTFKTLLLDVGLMNHFQKTSWLSIKNMTENKILTDGKIAEQFIGQQLLSLSPAYEAASLYYWLREGKSSNAEVDYVFESSPFIWAIEVKSGSAGKIRSLHQWVKDISYKKKKCIRFNLSKGAREGVEYRFENEVLKYKLHTLPLYLVENLSALVPLEED